MISGDTSDIDGTNGHTKSRREKEGKRILEVLHKGSEHLESQMEQGEGQVTTGLDLSVGASHAPTVNKNSHFLPKPRVICTWKRTAEPGPYNLLHRPQKREAAQVVSRSSGIPLKTKWAALVRN